MAVLTMPSSPPAPDDDQTQVPVSATLNGWRPASMAQSWAWTALVAAIATVTRLWSLGFPSEKIFDEVYYATEAQEMLRFGYEDDRGYMFVVHPPLGKWLIALGSAAVGNDSLGWRLAPALAGIATVIALTRLAMRMFRSVLLGVVAGLLLTLDGISLVISRVALLDVFLEFFVLAGFAALVIDRDRMRDTLAGMVRSGFDMGAGIPSLGPRPWRLMAGLLFGCAFAVKWSALSFWVGFAGLSLLWDVGALNAAGVNHPWRSVLTRSWFWGAFSLGLAGVGSYLLAWAGWFFGANSWNRNWGQTHPGSGLFGLLPGPIRALLNYHHQAYQFHTHLHDSHPYRSNPWSWLVLGRPILFYYPTDPTGCGSNKCVRSVLLIGTPVMYWAMLPALLWLGWRFVSTRDWRAGAILMAFLVGWGVWLQNTERTAFLFYMAPLMPFLVLGLTMAVGSIVTAEPVPSDGPPEPAAVATEPPPTLDQLAEPAAARGRFGVLDRPGRLGRPDRREGPRVLDRTALQALGRRRLVSTALVCGWLGAVIADFAWMWPIYTGGLMSYDQWLRHMWFPSWI